MRRREEQKNFVYKQNDRYQKGSARVNSIRSPAELQMFGFHDQEESQRLSVNCEILGLPQPVKGKGRKQDYEGNVQINQSKSIYAIKTRIDQELANNVVRAADQKEEQNLEN